MPTQRPIIIACSDPWLDPARIFDLEEGDAYVIRTAGNIITQETTRSIMLALITDKISDVIVLGHTNCSITSKERLFKRLDAFFAKLPQRSYFKEIFSTREKAMRYLGIVGDEVANIRTQVENLKYLRTIQPTLNVTGMFYNTQNGHVYTLPEIDQVRGILVRDPKKDITSLVPTRYTEFAKSVERAAGSTSPGREGVKIKEDTMARPVKEKEVEIAGKEDIKEGGGTAFPEPKADVPDRFTGQQLAFEKLMDAMKKSITKASKVRVFMPKIRLPRVKDVIVESNQEAPPG